jgi:hypothetical protein
MILRDAGPDVEQACRAYRTHHGLKPYSFMNGDRAPGMTLECVQLSAVKGDDGRRAGA